MHRPGRCAHHHAVSSLRTAVLPGIAPVVALPDGSPPALLPGATHTGPAPAARGIHFSFVCRNRVGGLRHYRGKCTDACLPETEFFDFHWADDGYLRRLYESFCFPGFGLQDRMSTRLNSSHVKISY